MTKENNKIALLIDADNTSAKYIKTIIDELTLNYGVLSLKRVYGDWTNECLKPWKSVMLEYSLTPMQQFSYTSGKNSTDSAMIIDAMDILYTKEIDTFCLATSDSDFTKIASRLRESGKLVVGMGRSQTPKAFISACNEFKYLDVIESKGDGDAAVESDNEVGSVSGSNITPLKDIEEFAFDIINSTDTHTIQLGRVKQILLSQFSDFDERNYGFTKFSTFINSFNEFTVRGNDVKITESSNPDTDRIRAFVVNTLESVKSATSVELQNRIAKQFKNFRLKSHGYSNMKSFLNSIDKIRLDNKGKYSLK